MDDPEAILAQAMVIPPAEVIVLPSSNVRAPEQVTVTLPDVTVVMSLGTKTAAPLKTKLPDVAVHTVVTTTETSPFAVTVAAGDVTAGGV